MDLESGAVVFVGDGKGADALKPFWKRPRPSGAKIEAVAMDMSGAYQQAVATHLPRAKIVFGHFHLIKLFNEKPSGSRSALYREAIDVLQKAALKGTRWLLLRNLENLDRYLPGDRRSRAQIGDLQDFIRSERRRRMTGRVEQTECSGHGGAIPRKLRRRIACRHESHTSYHHDCVSSSAA
jgi:transposase